MLVEQSVLIDDTNDITASQQIIRRELLVSNELPQFFLVKLRHFDTTRNEHTLCFLSDDLKRALNSVKNVIENSY